MIEVIPQGHVEGGIVGSRFGETWVESEILREVGLLEGLAHGQAESKKGRTVNCIVLRVTLFLTTVG